MNKRMFGTGSTDPTTRTYGLDFEERINGVHPMQVLYRPRMTKRNFCFSASRVSIRASAFPCADFSSLISARSSSMPTVP